MKHQIVNCKMTLSKNNFPDKREKSPDYTGSIKTTSGELVAKLSFWIDKMIQSDLSGYVNFEDAELKQQRAQLSFYYLNKKDGDGGRPAAKALLTFASSDFFKHRVELWIVEKTERYNEFYSGVVDVFNESKNSVNISNL